MSAEAEFKAATLAFAKTIGIDLDNEPELVKIAKKALLNLPKGWEVCISDEDDSNCVPFFHNEETDESVWYHPEEEKYIRMVKKERKYLEEDRRAEKNRAKDKDTSSKKKTDDYDRRDDDGYNDNNDDHYRSKKNDSRSKNSTEMNNADYDDGYHTKGKRIDDAYNDFDGYGDSSVKSKGNNYSSKNVKKYDDYDDDDYERDHRKGKGRETSDTRDEYQHQDNQKHNSSHYYDYDDHNYDDYDPDAELAKLNTSWGSGQYEKEKKSSRDKEKNEDTGGGNDEVMMLDVEDFNDDTDTAFDFMPSSANSTTGKETKKKSGGNAIFGDHWLEEAETEAETDKGIADPPAKNRDQSEHRREDEGRDRDRSSKDYNHSKSHGAERGRTADRYSSSSQQHREEDRDRDRSRSKSRGREDRGRDATDWSPHRTKTSTDKDKYMDRYGGSSTEADPGVVDNWGREHGRDRLEEATRSSASRSDHWGTTGGGGSTDTNHWGEKNHHKEQDSSSTSRVEWQPKQTHHEDQRHSTDSPIKRGGTVSSSDMYVKDTERGRDRDRERDHQPYQSNQSHHSYVERTSPHVQAGVVDTLRAEVSRLQSQIEELRAQHSSDLREMDSTTHSLRSSLQIGEVSLQSERVLRSKAEAATRDSQLEIEKLRLQIQNMMHTPSAEFEALKRAEIENVTIRITDEWTQKLKTIELKYSKEVENEQRLVSSLRQDVSLHEETIRDMEKQNRFLKEEMALKVKQSRDSSSAKTADLESALRNMETELNRVKEEYSSMAARAASALQQAKVSKAEAESLRAETSSIVSDGHTSHAALMQALQRVQQLETELLRSKTEKEVLQQDIDNQYAELRKYQDVSISKEGKNQLSAMELKRSKAHFENELSRMKSRTAELEANNMILQSQLDKASEAEMSSQRELQRRLDRGEHENIRLQEKVRENEEKLRESQVKVASLEREVMTFQDTIFRKDRATRELTAKLDSLTGQREQLREALEAELDGLQAELKSEQEHSKSLERSHQKEMEDLKQDVESRIPSIVSGVTNQAEKHFNEQLQNEIAGVKARCTHQLNALKHEMVEMQAAHQEAIVRLKSRASNETIEMDAMRQKCVLLETKNKELTSTIDTLAARTTDVRHLQLSNSRPAGYALSVLDSSSLNTTLGNVTVVGSSGSGGGPEDIDTTRVQGVGAQQQYILPQQYPLPQHPPPDALHSITAQLSNMRTQLNQSMEMRTSFVKTQNDSGALSRQQWYHQEEEEESRGRRQSQESAQRAASGKENAAPRPSESSTGANIHRERERRPFTSSRHASKSTTSNGANIQQHSKIMHESSTIKYENANSSSDGLGTPPSKGKSKYISAFASPEALFDSPLRSSLREGEESTLHLDESSSDYMHVGYQKYAPQSHTQTSKTLGDSQSFFETLDSSSTLLSSSKLTSDFSSIQDGGYHEGYWKAKYLRR